METTRDVSGYLVAAICFCLASFAARVALDTVFVQFSAGFRPSIAPSVPAESALFDRFHFRVSLVLTPPLSFCVPSSFSVPC